MSDVSGCKDVTNTKIVIHSSFFYSINQIKTVVCNLREQRCQENLIGFFFYLDGGCNNINDNFNSILRFTEVSDKSCPYQR